MADFNKATYLKQLRRVAINQRPWCCLGCGYEHDCSIHGCAVIRMAERLIEEDGNESETSAQQE